MQIWNMPGPFHRFMPSETQHSSSYISCILIVQEEIHNIKPQFYSDSIQTIALPKTGGFFCFVFLRLEGSSQQSVCKIPYHLISNAGKWVAPFGFHSNSTRVPNEREFCNYIVTSSNVLHKLQRKDISGKQLAQ